METIDPRGLARMMAKHQPFVLIDVRPREQFEAAHICGARSVPLDRLSPARIAREAGNDDLAVTFLVCRRHVRASLAAGMLQSTGQVRPVILAGGMELWEAQGLPTTSANRAQMPAPLRRLFQGGHRGRDLLRLAREKARRTIQRVFPMRPADNDWSCPCDFPPRQSCRG